LLNCFKFSPLSSVVVFQAISEAFKMATDTDLEWTATVLYVKIQVSLPDRLMTDAALGTVSIKSEHSYSLTSDGDSIPGSPLSPDNKMDGEYDFTELPHRHSTADRW
jgi:cyclic AMP-responsive element-binding protein 3